MDPQLVRPGLTANIGILNVQAMTERGGGGVESDTMNRGGLWFGRDDGLAAKDHRMRWDDERGGQHEKKKKKKKREDAGRRQNRDFP